MELKSMDIEIKGPRGTFSGYFSSPSVGKFPGVVVIQEIFGVNVHIRSVCDRLALEGYAVLAPDLFWSIRPNIKLGYTPDDIAEGRGYKDEMNLDAVVEDVRATFDTLSLRNETGGTKMGLTGFCWGGLVSYLSACRLQPAATAAYYGGGIVNFLDEASNINAPIIFHFGEQDKGIPMDQVGQIQARVTSLPDSAVYTYPEADHGFHCDMRGSYHAESAKQAWQRSLAFFQKHLKG